MTKIARAVRKAKKRNPNPWSLTSTDLANAKDFMMCYFKIPIDEATGFVEMLTDASYDTTHRIMLQEELLGTVQNTWNQYDANRVYKLTKYWTPENPAAFKQLSLRNRRKYMPGLIFN